MTIVVGWRQDRQTNHWHVMQACGQVLCKRPVFRWGTGMEGWKGMRPCPTCQQLLNEGLLNGSLEVKPTRR